MNVLGYEVPKEVEDAALNAMVGEFVSRDIEKAAIAAGAPEVINVGWSREYCAHRIADRLLQREKKKGRISLHGRKWRANPNITGSETVRFMD